MRGERRATSLPILDDALSRSLKVELHTVGRPARIALSRAVATATGTAQHVAYIGPSHIGSRRIHVIVNQHRALGGVPPRVGALPFTMSPLLGVEAHPLQRWEETRPL